MSKIYSNGKNKFYALDNVSFSINKGEFVAITGKSGSGKSTLMNILGCLDIQSQGEYYLNGENISELSAKQLSKIRGKEVGFVFQGFHLLNNLTAKQNVMLPLKYAHVPRKEREQRAIEALSQVSLIEKAENYPNELSGGQEQRVAIARAIVTNPSIILADEPTGNLDTINTEQILNLLKNLWQMGKTIIMITHEKTLPDYIQKNIVVNDGKIKVYT